MLHSLPLPVSSDDIHTEAQVDALWEPLTVLTHTTWLEKCDYRITGSLQYESLLCWSMRIPLTKLILIGVCIWLTNFWTYAVIMNLWNSLISTGSHSDTVKITVFVGDSCEPVYLLLFTDGCNVKVWIFTWGFIEPVNVKNVYRQLN